MKLSEIKEIAEIMKNNQLSRLDIDEGDLHIHVERNLNLGTTSNTVSVNAPETATLVTESANSLTIEPANAEQPVVQTVAEAKDTIKSPIVGVFYLAASPDSEPFVSVGSKVKKGDILCIVEAMKLMNEIHADKDGEIIEVCVNNGDLVEYDQVLFKLA